MSMTTTTYNFGFPLSAPQVPQFIQPQLQLNPGQQMLEALAGLFQALAPMLRGMGFQPNQQTTSLGNPFQQQPFGQQGFGFTNTTQQFGQTTGFTPLIPQANPFGQQLPVTGQQPVMSQDRAAQVLKENWDKASKRHDGKKVTRESLQDVLKDPTASAELKEAAQYLLSSDQAFKNLDRANATKHGNYKQKADGDIARVDVDAALEGIPFTAKEQQVAKTLLDNLDVLGNGNKVFNQGDLAKILATGLMPNGQPASPAMLAAAQYLAANPSFFNKLEETHLARNPGVDGPHKDGLVGIEDLQAAIGKR